MTECRRFRISGKVQGVWFRESTRALAEKLQLQGSAMNCADGSVVVIACGDAVALDELRDWLQQGPEQAAVDVVAEWPHDAAGHEGFRTGWQQE